MNIAGDEAEKELIQKEWQAKAQENKNRIPQKKDSQTFGLGWDKPRQPEPERESSNPSESTVDYKKRGNSIIVEALLNNDVTANLVVDTGATTVLLSREIAEELGNNLSWGNRVMARLADGRVIQARGATLKSIIVGDMEAKNVSAAVLEEEEGGGIEDGLLGMSFLNKFIFHIDAANNSLVLESKE